MQQKFGFGNRVLALLFVSLIWSGCALAKSDKQGVNYRSFKPGELWFDTDSVHINAHGGGMLFHEGTYYWFGEHKTAGRGGNTALVGVRVYSSTDLYNWKNEGVALEVLDEPGHDIERGSVIERPKVLYNEETGKFVMWFHLELKGQGYHAARTAVAIADDVTGPYQYIRSLRPNAGYWPLNLDEEHTRLTETIDDFNWWTPDWEEAVHKGLFVRRDFEGGQMSRDMTLFLDDDGTAYHIYSSEENLTLHIAELSEDFLLHTGRYVRIFPAGHNEAPALFKRNGRYYLIASGCTGWDPNAARSFVADHIFGPWESLGNPCIGDRAEITFESQSTYVLPVQGKDDAFIFMGDRWRPRNPIDGRYVWLPIRFEDDRPIIEWHDEWNLSVFDN